LATTGLTTPSTHAQEIDADSYHSIVEALQLHIEKHPSVFPLEANDGGIQTFVEGLRSTYYAYGERRYTHRTDFHPAFDVAYSPKETGTVQTIDGQQVIVRAPQSYLKKIHAIQEGLLFAVERKSTGYKVILEHSLETPYYDSKGRAYDKYYTCYRHVDPRTLVYLTLLAREILKDDSLLYEDLVGRYVFEAGEVIAFVGFDPTIGSLPPRAHLDFSLNLFPKPDSGKSIRDYSLNPLLLFPPFGYGDPYTHQQEDQGLPVYRFVVDPESIEAPTKRRDGSLEIEIHAGMVGPNGDFVPSRYFALNAIQISIHNGGEMLGEYRVDRHLKAGYDPSSYETLDEHDERVPHFSAPLGEQGDIYRMGVVLPSRWLRKVGYDWSRPGSISVEISGIWDGYLSGHSESVEIPLAQR
jgi:hypothetical protein